MKESRLTMPMKGHLEKHNLPPVKFLREVPIEVAEKSEESKSGSKGWRPGAGGYFRR